MSVINKTFKDPLHQTLSQNFIMFAQQAFREKWGHNFEVKSFHKEVFAVMQMVYSGKIQRLIINIPPRHGKSEIVALFQAYVFFNNPTAKNMLICYASDLQSEKNALIQSYVQTPMFKKYSETRVYKRRKGLLRWETEQGGIQFSATINGKILGAGAGDMRAKGAQGGLIVIDDPNKASEMHHTNYRESIIDIFNNTISTRGNSEKTPIVIIQQRLHEDDLTGWLLSGGDGNVWHQIKVPVYNDNRTNTIFPEKVSLKGAEIKERSNPTTFAGQYLQEPQRIEGGIIKRPWFHLITPEQIPDNFDIHMWIDGAYTAKQKNDPSGIIVTTYDHKKGNLFIIHAEKARLEMPQLIERIKKLKQIFNTKIVFVEPKASGKTLVQLLKDIAMNSSEIKSKYSISDKNVKAHDISAYIEAGRVFLKKAPWNADYLHEMAVFPNGRHDDYMDCTFYAIERYMMKKRSVWGFSTI